MKNIIIDKENVLFADVTDNAEKLYHTGAFEMYAISSDNSFILLESAEELTGHLSKGCKIVAKIGELPEDVEKLYTFEELDDAAKKAALEKMSDINVDYSWWDFTYNDAEDVGIEIRGFDLYRRRSIDINIDYKEGVAKKILENHGEESDTYLAAKKYLDGISELSDEEINESSDKFLEIEEEFVEDLESAYLSLLRHEYEYLTSEEAIRYTILANKYLFDSGGNLR